MDDVDLPPRPGVRLGRRQLIGLDVLAAVLYLAVAASLAHQEVSAIPLWSRLLLVGVLALPMAVRRWRPLAAYLVAVLGSVIAVLADTMLDPLLSAVFTAYLVALTQPRRRWLPTAAIALLSLIGLVGTVFGAGDPAPPPGSRPATDGHLLLVVLGLVLMGGSWTVGRAVRDRRVYATRSAAAQAARAVSDERLRIARELHDVVAHSMGVIAVKAGVANHVAVDARAEVHEALQVIEVTSREALVQMRHMLGVLRSDGDSHAVLTPAPGIEGIPELTRRAATMGVTVTLDITREELPEGIGLSVYRIVQEALTNVARHAAPAGCRVTVAAGDGVAHVEVSDDGRGSHALAPKSDGGGHGLIGMRERVAMYGGTFSAGVSPTGGFRVAASLPYAQDRP